MMSTVMILVMSCVKQPFCVDELRMVKCLCISLSVSLSVPLNAHCVSVTAFVLFSKQVNTGQTVFLFLMVTVFPNIFLLNEFMTKNDCGSIQHFIKCIHLQCIYPPTHTHISLYFCTTSLIMISGEYYFIIIDR